MFLLQGDCSNKIYINRALSFNFVLPTFASIFVNDISNFVSAAIKGNDTSQLT